MRRSALVFSFVLVCSACGASNVADGGSGGSSGGQSGGQSGHGGGAGGGAAGGAVSPSDAGSEDDGGVGDTDPGDAGNEDGDFDGGVETYDAGPDAPDEPDPVDAGVAPPEVTVVEKTYQLMQWNIAGGKENDCRPDLIARAVKRFVVDHGVDFVGLNEVCPGQHEAIRDALRAAWGLGPNVPMSAFVGDGVPRIVGDSIYSRFGFSTVMHQQLGTDVYGSRNLVCGKSNAEPHVRFCGTHLSVGDGPASSQMRTVLDRLELWWTNNGDTVFLTGDLNLTANNPGLDPVYSSQVNTPNNRNNTGKYHELDDADPAHCPGYGERSTPGTAGGPCQMGGKIDFIFARQNRIVNDTYSAETLNIPTDCTGACSDHRPEIGTVKVKVRRD
ncbi:MAG: endonuclease/exonuclease/phosphatase family protein [Archangiaceae bacterium]|nr:endonuclease/exonuclease/phosphatase family protein [Archangiaceae bacterium]